MKRRIDFETILQLATLATMLLSLSVSVMGQQQPPTVTRPSASSVQVTPRGTASPLGSATNATTGMKPAVGAITGFVYWQMNVLQPSSTCQGLTVKVVTVSKVGMPLQLLSTTNSLTASGPMTDTSSPGTPKYMLCSYAFQNMPENVALRVLLYGTSSSSVSMPSPFQIPGGNCNSTPSSSFSFILTGGELLCGNGAFNINFKVTSAAVAAPRPTTPSILLPHAPSPGGMLSQPQAAPANATPGAPKTSGATLLSPNPIAPGSASSTPASNGMLAPPVKSGSGAATGGSGGFTGGVKQGAAPPQKLLTNADVIRMQKAGISESVIVHSIQSSTSQFDFSPTSLQALRQAHVSPKVLAAMCDGSTRACPQDVGTIATASPGSKVELNPQPFPPRTAANAAGGTPGATVSLNAKPLPPKVDISKLRKGIVVKNPMLGNSAILLTLKLQKQAADLQAGQVLSAQVGSRASSTATSPPVLTGGAPSGGSKATDLLIPTRRATICAGGHTTISAVNQQASNLSRTTNTTYSPIVFTSDPAYNHYTIAGCGFGTTPGQIYLTAGPSSFSAHNGRVLLVPANGQTWGNQWSDTFIDAHVDPTVSAEFDQNNVNLIVEPLSGTPAQASGFSFYAKRGSPIPISSVPQGDWTVNFDFGGALPDIGDEWNSPVSPNQCWCAPQPDWTAMVYHFHASRFTDTFTLKLAPGFVVESAAPLEWAGLQGSQITVANNQIQIAANQSGAYILTVSLIGPAGLTNPWPTPRLRNRPMKLH